MSESTSNTRLNWIYTIVSLIAVIVFLMFFNEWFWIPLAFFLTYLVKAMDVI